MWKEKKCQRHREKEKERATERQKRRDNFLTPAHTLLYLISISSQNAASVSATLCCKHSN